jgi:hypothetical protein
MTPHNTLFLEVTSFSKVSSACWAIDGAQPHRHSATTMETSQAPAEMRLASAAVPALVLLVISILPL